MTRVNVINLERSADRRTEFARNNPHLAPEWVKAVDGGALTLTDIAQSGLFRPGLDYTAGAYGVALSHHALWSRAAASGQALTVAEDDAIFRADFAEASARVLAALPAEWDIIQWGFNFDSVLALRLFDMSTVISFNHAHTALALAAFRDARPEPAPWRLEASFGLPCYSITPAGARKFLAGCFPLADFNRTIPSLPQKVRNRGIDIAMTAVYPGVSAFVAFPPLVVTANDRAKSTIQDGRYISR
jgi:GR25 family glycosyltransferase involved in LPS biosynthesis